MLKKEPFIRGFEDIRRQIDAYERGVSCGSPSLWRMVHGKTAGGVANRVYLSRAGLIHYENRKIPMPVEADRLAEAYGTTVDCIHCFELFGPHARLSRYTDA